MPARLAALAWVALGAVILALVAVYDPVRSNVFPPCPFFWATGLYCPGCGSLRSMHQLVHGHVGAALCYNPLAVLFVPYIAYGMTSQVLEALGRRPLPSFMAWAGWGRAVLIVVLGYWFLRNIPAWPFTLLAPR